MQLQVWREQWAMQTLEWKLMQTFYPLLCENCQLFHGIFTVFFPWNFHAYRQSFVKRLGVDEKGGVVASTTLTETRRFDTGCNVTTTDAQWLRSLSFDAARGRLLMMTARRQHNDDVGFSLISAPMCHECSNNGSNIQTYFMDAQISLAQFKVCQRYQTTTFKRAV